MAEAKSSEADGVNTENPETLDLYCDPCREDGNFEQVKGYCINCDDHLCESCYDVHLKPRPMRDHILQDATVMPGHKLKRQENPSRNTKCQFHVDEDLSSYCKSHDELCCETCILTWHFACKSGEEIIEINDVDSAEEIAEFEKNIEDAINRCETNKRRATLHLDRAHEVYDETIDNMKTTLDAIKLADICKMNSIVETCEGVQKQLKTWQREKDNLKTKGHKKQLFILVKKSKRQLGLTERTFNSIERDNKVVEYNFYSYTKPYLVIGNIERINNEINLEGTDTIISGIAVVDRDHIIVADSCHKCIKLINTQSTESVSTVNVESKPHHIAISDRGEIYVGLPESHKLLHMSVESTKLSIKREIRLMGKFYAFAIYNDKIKVLLDKDSKFIETDMNGNMLRIIGERVCDRVISHNGKQISPRPTHGVLNKKTGSLIVTCWQSNSIVELSDDGKVNLVLHESRLLKPHGIAKDDRGNLLVCNFGGCNVIRVDSDRYISNMLIDDLDFSPYAISFDKASRKIYVGGKSDNILIFDI